MRMLTRHGDEIVDAYLSNSWDEYRDYIECIDVTPVNKFMNRNPDIFEDVREDFGCIRPPWENTWAEYVVQKDNGLKRGGIDIHPTTDGEYEAMKERVDEEVVEALFENEDAEHFYTFLCFIDRGSDWKAEGLVFLFLDEEGRCVPEHRHRFFPLPYDEMSDATGDADKARLILVSRIMPALLGFGFAHCPNVKVWEDEKPEPVRENRRSKGQNPGQIFKCLDIEPLKEEMRRASSGDGREVDRREHTVRGHFRHYTEDAPLFGHYTGNVWVPAHKRGSKEHGTVEKDYRSKPPEGGE